MMRGGEACVQARRQMYGCRGHRHYFFVTEKMTVPAKEGREKREERCIFNKRCESY